MPSAPLAVPVRLLAVVTMPAAGAAGQGGDEPPDRAEEAAATGRAPGSGPAGEADGGTARQPVDAPGSGHIALVFAMSRQ